MAAIGYPYINYVALWVYPKGYSVSKRIQVGCEGVGWDMRAGLSFLVGHVYTHCQSVH